MLAAIQAQKKSKQWEDGFILNPANWLKGERWKDKLQAEQVENSSFDADEVLRTRLARTYSSFDADEFFQAALDRTYGEGR